jgi:hypothetical protein
MANKERDIDRGTEPRDIDPNMGADDRIEKLRGTTDDETDDFDESDEEVDEEEEEDEGTF